MREAYKGLFRMVGVASMAAALVGAGTATAEAQTGQPDLVVDLVNWSGGGPGAEISFGARIRNLGTAASPAGVVHGVGFYIDGHIAVWSDDVTTSIPPGGLLWVYTNGGPSGKSTWTATAGAHKLEAFVDDVNRIAESNESNNILTKALNVGVDLLVSQEDGLGFVPTADGRGLTFYAYLTNQGTQSTPDGAALKVRFFVDGVAVANGALPYTGIPTLSTHRVEASTAWTPTVGTHTLKAVVDPDNGIAEVDESNNASSKTITLRPDLIVTDIGWNPANVGEEVTFTATIKNQGTLPTPAGVIDGVAFWTNGRQLSWSDNVKASIPIGGSITVTANGGPSGKATWTRPAGDFTILAYVDDVNRIEELDENNNIRNEPFPPKVDLVVTGVSAASRNTPPVAGDRIQLSAGILNAGNLASPDGVPHVVSFRVDGVEVDRVSTYTTSIPAGGSTLISNFGWFGVAGTHTITAVVDPDNTIPEWIETNNSNSTTVTVNTR